MPGKKGGHTDAGSGGESAKVEIEMPTMLSINSQGQRHDVAWPSKAATDLGVVACENGHPNVPDATSGAISCGCGSTEVRK